MRTQGSFRQIAFRSLRGYCQGRLRCSSEVPHEPFHILSAGRQQELLLRARCESAKAGVVANSRARCRAGSWTWMAGRFPSRPPLFTTIILWGPRNTGQNRVKRRRFERTTNVIQREIAPNATRDISNLNAQHCDFAIKTNSRDTTDFEFARVPDTTP